MDIVERLRKDAAAWGMATNTKTGPFIAALENEAAAEIERLRERVRQLTFLLDEQLGTPCQQIRHQQDVENLTAEIERLKP
jgi:hypothetical protein